MRSLLLVRHCESSGQAPEAPLTDRGLEQARALADWLEARDLGIDRIVSSPYRRAVQTAEPFATRRGVALERDERLREKVLSAESLPDWREHVRRGFDDLDHVAPGGESSRVAQARGLAVLRELSDGGAERPMLVSHGNLLGLILRSVDPSFRYRAWSAMTNPDVYRLWRDDAAVPWRFERLWERS